jgi:hypothetical protein
VDRQEADPPLAIFGSRRSRRFPQIESAFIRVHLRPFTPNPFSDMKLLAWLLGPLTFREQLALLARFPGWLFGRTIDVDERPQLVLAVPPRADNSPGNSPPREPRPKAAPPRWCVAVYRRDNGKLVAVGPDRPEPITPLVEAAYASRGCTLPLRIEVAVATRAMRKARAELNAVQVVTVVPVHGAIDNLPHGAPPDASIPTGYEPSAETPAVWPHKKRRAS